MANTMILPRSVRRALLGLVALLTLTSVYRAVTSAQELTQAQQTLVQMQTELQTTRDSLGWAQGHIERLTQQVKDSRLTLRRIRRQVEETNVHYEQQQRQTARGQNTLRQRWQAQRAAWEQLQQEAKQWPLE